MKNISSFKFRREEREKRFKGISSLEYAMIFGVILLGLLIAMPILRQSVSGRIKESVDKFGAGRQFDPEETTMTDHACIQDCDTNCKDEADSYFATYCEDEATVIADCETNTTCAADEKRYMCDSDFRTGGCFYNCCVVAVGYDYAVSLCVRPGSDLNSGIETNPEHQAYLCWQQCSGDCGCNFSAGDTCIPRLLIPEFEECCLERCYPSRKDNLLYKDMYQSCYDECFSSC